MRAHPDGSQSPYGRLTPEAGAVWNSILDSLAKPQPGEDGTPDPRSAGQRRHDALLDAGQRLLRSDLPGTGGTPVTILVLMRIEDFLTGTGNTSHGDRVSVAAILRNAADAQVIPVMLSDTGGILAYGQTRRLASCSQRMALAARDRGCSFPGCTRPPAWCEAHHVIAWIDGGPTDLDNLTLLCGYHHRNFEALGWACHITNGIPEWTPPRWLDPDRTPRRNKANHIEITLDTG